MNKGMIVVLMCCISFFLCGCTGTSVQSTGTNESINEGDDGMAAATGIKAVKTVRKPSLPAGRHMLPADFSSSLRQGATVVYFAKIACPSCKKQDVIWKKVLSNLPAGTQAEKRFSYGIDPRKYGVHQLPTLIFYRDGLEISRHVGVMSENDIYRNLKRAR